MDNLKINAEINSKMSDLTSELLYISHSDGRLKYVNTAFIRILKYTEDEINQINMFSLIHPDDISKFKDALSVVSKQKISNSECRILCKDKTYKWISWNIKFEQEDGFIYGAGFDVTKNKFMEDKLKSKRESLYNVLSSADAIIFQIDKYGTVLLYEGRGIAKTGRKPGEYVGKSIFKIYKDNEIIVNNVKKALKGEQINFEEKIGNIMFHANCSPFKGEDGNINGLIAIATDITTRKNIETELMHTKERLLDAQKFSHIGYWEYNAKNKKLLWSDELFCIYGYKPQEFIPTENYFLDIIHPDDEIIAKKSMQEALHNGILEYDIRIIKKDNSVSWIHEKVIHEYDKSGSLMRIYGVVQDITKHKFSEISLKESQQKYKEITNNVPAGILSYDKEGNITFVNPKALEILGSPSSVETMSINLFTFPALIQCGISDICKDCIENGLSITIEKQYTTKWGKPIVLRIKATPIIDENGKVISAIAIIEDFTDRKNLETELLIAKEQAELSNKAKSQFLSNMSHEIRTPMNGIIGMAELLTLTRLTDEQIDMVNTIKSSSNHLLQIINDILDLSKIDAGKVELCSECINIYDLVSEKSSIFTALAQKKGLIFETCVDSNVPKEVIVDKTRLTQVLSNLIGNAIKFTEKGKINVSVKRVKDIENKVKLMFSVTDTGIGIKEDEIFKLFNYFTQLDNTITKKFQGAGLGLAISKSLVELMGGEICVESEFGKGSTFYFTCLFDIPEKRENALNNQGTITAEESSSGISILLVEDDYVSTLVMKQICKRKGWNIEVASNGREALDLLDKKYYDLILMDIQMPEMSGFDVTKEIRQKENSTGKHIPIIATTAYAMSGDAEKCISVGMDDYISKPIDIEKLCSIIEKWTK